jgi:phage shock protein PspC (stress-responsive transcriptional regulator)
MNKAINITINNQIFYIEEKAYEELDIYLESIKNHFSTFEDKDEIIEDIESRIAEKLSSRISSKKEVIIQKDVTAIIKSMGTVSDFAEFEESEHNAQNDSHKGHSHKNNEECPFQGHNSKKLYRDMDNAMLGGVSSGIAAYFGIDPILIRLLFVLTLFVGGTGVIIYIIMWVIMPEAKTTAQKLDMRGDNVTLKRIEQEVKDRVEKIDTEKISKVAHDTAKDVSRVGESFAKKLGGFFTALGRSFGPTAITLSRVVLGFFGVIFIFAGIVALIATGFSVIAVLFNVGASFIDFPISEVFPGALRYVAFISLFFIVAIPLILLIMIGSSLVRAKSAFSLGGSVVLISVWVISLMVGGVVGLERSSEIQDKIHEVEVTYSENKITKNLEELDDFSKIDISNAYVGNITQAEEFSVKLTGGEKEIEQTQIFVSDGELVIRRKGDFKVCIFCTYRSATIDITMPSLNEVELSGASRLVINGFSEEDFNVNLSGASRVEANSNFESVEMDISGASRASFVGTGDNLVIEMSGASRIDFYEFFLQSADIDASGASRAEINISTDLKAAASGASSIYYKGDATISDIDTSGGSRVEKN